jgi:hypothetical protein
MAEDDINMRRAWIKPALEAELCESSVKELVKLPKINTPIVSGCGDGCFISPGEKVRPVASTIGETLLQPGVWYEHFWVVRKGQYTKDFLKWAHQYIKPLHAAKVPQNFPPTSAYVDGCLPGQVELKRIFMSSRVDATFDRFLPVTQEQAEALDGGKYGY